MQIVSLTLQPLNMANMRQIAYTFFKNFPDSSDSRFFLLWFMMSTVSTAIITHFNRSTQTGKPGTCTVHNLSFILAIYQFTYTILHNK